MSTRFLRVVCLLMGILLCFRLNWLITLIVFVIFLILGLFDYYKLMGNDELKKQIEEFSEDIDELKDEAIDFSILIVIFLIIVILVLKVFGL